MQQQNGLHIPEPTEAEITETIEQVKSKDGVELSKPDAVRYLKLRQELGQWLTADKYYEESQSITDEMAAVLERLLGQATDRAMSVEEARLRAERSFLTVSHKQQERIIGEIRVIIDQYKQKS